MYVCMYVYMHIGMYVCLYMYVCMHVSSLNRTYIHTYNTYNTCTFIPAHSTVSWSRDDGSGSRTPANDHVFNVKNLQWTNSLCIYERTVYMYVW